MKVHIIAIYPALPPSLMRKTMVDSLCKINKELRGAIKESEEKYMIAESKLINAQKEIDRLLSLEAERKAKILEKIERILGFRLYEWQKNFILKYKPYGEEINETRRAGKTLVHILRVCLSEGEPLKFTRDNLYGYAGEDKSTPVRMDCFIMELKKVYGTLKQAGVTGLREIKFREESFMIKNFIF